MSCGSGSQTIGSLDFTIKGAQGQTINQDDYAGIVKALDTLAQLKYFQHNFREDALLSGFNNDVDIIIDYNASIGASVQAAGPESAFMAVITVNPNKLKSLEVKGVDGNGHSVNYAEALGNEFGNIIVMANKYLDFDGDGDGHNDWAGNPETRTSHQADLASIQAENVVRALAGRTARAYDENPFRTDANHDPSLSDEQIREMLIRANVEHANRGEISEIVGNDLDPGDTPCETEGWFSKFIRGLKPHNVPGKATPVEDSDTKTNIKGEVDGATDETTPIVLDLDGDGIELIAFDGQNQTFFDLNETGFAVRTGWVAADDGLLAIDWNDNGRIDNNGELFGSATTDGFTELSALDSNADGVIDAEDQLWEDLVIWRDANSDGVADFTWGEVESLDAYGIISLDLNAAEVSLTEEGHRISHTSSYTYDTGSGTATRDMADVWFEHDKSSTRYAQDYIFDLRAAYLIGARGYGTLPDLHIAISLDNDEEDEDSLIALVTDFSEMTTAEVFAADNVAMDAVQAIMYRWANVEDVNPTSRGPYIDARELAFLEAMTGEPFMQQGYRADPYRNAAANLKEAFALAHHHYFATLVAQTEAGAIFIGDVYFDLVSDSFVGIAGLNTAVLDDLETTATGLANTAAREAFWSNVVRVIEFTIGTANLDGSSSAALDAAITGSDAALDTDDILALLGPDPVNNIDGTSSGETINGTSGDDDIDAYSGDDVINAGAGDDNVSGGDGNDTIQGGLGDDFLSGDSGDNTFLYNLGDGTDVIDSSWNTGNDKIIFGAGIDAGDITLVRYGQYDLEVVIDTGAQTGKIIIANQFWANGGIETIEFDDTSTIDVTVLNYTINGTAQDDLIWGVGYHGGDEDTIYGGDGNDTINAYQGDNTVYGDAGNDKIYAGNGADTIYGGDGDDFINGGSYGNNVYHTGSGNDSVQSDGGNDTYHYTGGHDVYLEWGGTENIYLASGYTSGSTVYYKINNDLKIIFDEDNTITVSSFFSTSAREIENLHFDGGPTVDLTTASYTLQGDETNNTLSGSSSADTFYGEGGDDTITGADGNDFLYGGTDDDYLNGGYGDDYLNGGAGDDTLVGYKGNDTFYYVSGHDTFQESWSGTDTIEMAPGWTFEDITFRRYADVPNNLVLELGGANSITLPGHFQNTSQAFDYLVFADTSSYDLKTMQYETHGTSGNDSIAGIANNGSLNDIIYGHDGDDYVNASYGDDVIYGGEGNDTLKGHSGNDILDGEAGDDLLEGYSGDDDPPPINESRNSYGNAIHNGLIKGGAGYGTQAIYGRADYREAARG